MPVYRARYPKAVLIGIDVSEAAIVKCTQRYGHIARFVRGDHRDAPKVDVVIASNVLEHLVDDMGVVRRLLTQSQQLIVTTPYKERLIPGSEHVNSYDETRYRGLGTYTWTIFYSRGWTQYGWNLWFNTYAKNLLRPFLGKPWIRRRRQIMFRFGQ